MADVFAVPADNLTDTLIVDDLRAVDAALIEPLACVMKSIRLADIDIDRPSAVIGLGVMGLMHALALGTNVTGYDVNPSRVEWAQSIEIQAKSAEDPTPADHVFVCPGSQAAFNLGVRIANPGGVIAMFAPLPPSQDLQVPQDLYFKDIRLVHSYSCGPDDTLAAAVLIRAGRMRAEQVVSDFIGMDDLPAAYQQMKKGSILKPMVVTTRP